jgi:hypothetical protein
MNLQTNALARLRSLEKEPGGSAAWNRALYARITGDYRALAALPASGLSLLEWQERVNALSRSIRQETGLEDALKFAKAKGEKEFTSDLLFCIFHGEKPQSVGTGRAMYLEPGLGLILKDLMQASRAVRGGLFDVSNGDELALRLNVEPGPCVHTEGQVAVLDWGAWAMQYQRRLAVYYARSLDFMEHYWSLRKEDVDQERKPLDKLLGKLWLIPCLAGGASSADQGKKAVEVFASRPQVIPIRAVRDLSQSWSKEAPRQGTVNDPAVQRFTATVLWSSGFPNGTYLNLQGSLPFLYWNLNLSQLLRQAPFSVTVARLYLQNGQPNTGEAHGILENLADYDTYVGRLLANRLPPDQPNAKEKAYQKLAAQDSHYYLDLAEMFEKTDVAKGVVYFEKARASGADMVGIANAAEPFVLYYLSVGNKAKAKELAEEADTCGSASGFEAMQAYCLKTHDFARGLKAAQDEEDRYGHDGDVLNYIEAVRKEQPSFRDFDKLYQTKLAEVDVSAIPAYQKTTAPPVKGVSVVGSGRLLRAADIVVAVDGKAVRNNRDIRSLRRDFARRTGEEKNIPLTVYRQGQYLELKDTTAGLSVHDYGGGKAPSAATASLTPASRSPEPPPAVQASSATPSSSAAEQPYLRQLKLNGISGNPPRRLAMINGKTLAAGESASLKLDGQNVTVRCVSISESSASVEVDGASTPRELRLADSGAPAGR